MRMLPRHVNQLYLRLEEAASEGISQISYTELSIWYDQERITHTVWRDISEKWVEVTEALKYAKGDAKKSKLLVGDKPGAWALVYGQGLEVTENAWLKDSRTLAKIEFDPENDDRT